MFNIRFKRFIVFTLCISTMILLAINAPSAKADTISKKNFEILTKSLGFMIGGPSGSAKVAVIYDPNVQSTVSSADKIIELFSPEIKGPKVTLTAEKIAVTDKDRFENFEALYLVSGMEQHYNAIFEIASQENIITISDNVTCVDADKCVIAIRTEPNVDIFYSSNAAKATGTEFATAFNMMLTKR